MKYLILFLLATNCFAFPSAQEARRLVQKNRASYKTKCYSDWIDDLNSLIKSSVSFQEYSFTVEVSNCLTDKQVEKSLNFMKKLGYHIDNFPEGKLPQPNLRRYEGKFWDVSWDKK